MLERDYLFPAAAAFFAAAGMSLLWGFDFIRLTLGGGGPLGGAPGIGDAFFLLTGLCAAWAYWSLRGALVERLNYRALELPLRILCATTALFHLGLFGIALTGWLLPDGAVEVMTLTYWIPFLVVFGVIDIVVAVILFRDREQLPALFSVLALVTVVMGVAELSVLFSFLALFLLPLHLIIVGICLLHRPDVLEVV